VHKHCSLQIQKERDDIYSSGDYSKTYEVSLGDSACILA